MGIGDIVSLDALLFITIFWRVLVVGLIDWERLPQKTIQNRSRLAADERRAFRQRAFRQLPFSKQHGTGRNPTVPGGKLPLDKFRRFGLTTPISICAGQST